MIFTEPRYAGSQAPLVCLCPWAENSNGLVSLWAMLNFDAGELAKAVQFLAQTATALSCPPFRDRPLSHVKPEQREPWLKNVEAVARYCDRSAFPMTKIPLENLLRLIDGGHDPVHEDIAEYLEDASKRLRDEASIHKLLRLSDDSVKFYERPCEGWEEIIERFPDTQNDVEEASICFALERYAASCFHSTHVVERGLISLGNFLGVTDPKSGWTSTSNKLDSITKKKYADLTTFEAKHIEFLRQVQATVAALQSAWRNKISHAQGRLEVMTADFSARVAEEILIASRGFVRRLATDMPMDTEL